MSDPQIVEQIWVSVAEGAERTGFHPDHVRRLARENWRLPENARGIRIRKESNEYTILYRRGASNNSVFQIV